jgi:hypothetical protein
VIDCLLHLVTKGTMIWMWQVSTRQSVYYLAVIMGSQPKKEVTLSKSPSFPNPLSWAKTGGSLTKCVIRKFPVYYLELFHRYTCVSRTPCLGEMPETMSHNPRNSDITAIVASPWRSLIHLESCKASWTILLLTILLGTMAKIGGARSLMR